MKPTSTLDLTWQEWIALHARTVLIAGVALMALLVAAWFVEWPGGTLVAGRVTSQGRPVTFGTVTILDASNRVHRARLDADGGYVLRGVPPGPVRIAVSSPNPRSVIERAAAAGGSATAPTGPRRDDATVTGGHAPAVPATGGSAARSRDKAGDAAKTPGVSIAAASQASLPPPPPGPGVVPRDWFQLPGHYANPATSGISGDVRRGWTSLDLELD